MIQLHQKVDLLTVTGKTLQIALVQKESSKLGNYVWQTLSAAFRASPVKATNDLHGVETGCFPNGTNNAVATPSPFSSSHRASFN